MIHRNAAAWQAQGWQRQLATAITGIDELFDQLGLDRAALPAARAAAAGFPLRVPRAYAALMRRGDPADPLLLQVLPQGAEQLPADGFSSDPVADGGAQPFPGVLHKYPGRLLLIASESCAIHCRYCFRRHFPYASSAAGRDRWRQALDYLRGHPEVNEVILSGGDPLTLSDDRLAELLAALAGVASLTRLRIHSRLPVLVPARLTRRLTELLGDQRLQTLLVLHCNHARELTPEFDAALLQLRAAGVTLLNQSVLLRGVNDDADRLCALSERLFAAGVLPYYLHQLDRVTGAAHFEVSDSRALALQRALQARLPGYLVPRLVRDLPGQPYKLPVA